MNKNIQQILVNEFANGLMRTHEGTAFMKAPDGTNLSLSSKEAFHTIKSAMEESSDDFATKGQVLTIINQLNHEASKLLPSNMDVRISSTDEEILLHMNKADVRIITKEHRKRCKNDKSFIRTENSLPLPDLVTAKKDILYSLNDLANLDEEQFACFLSWILAVFMPEGTIPILAISGPKESGKTTIARIAKALIDPSKEDVHKLSSPQALKELCKDNKVIVFDDLTHIPNSMVNGLCEAASRKKSLNHVDFSSTPTEHKSRTAIILCSENNVLASSQLKKIAIPLETQRISSDRWKTPDYIVKAFKNQSGMLLYALLKTLKRALKHYESPAVHTPLAHTFAWTTAWEPWLYKKGEVKAYLREAISNLGSLPATAEVFEKELSVLLKKKRSWSGTPSDLLNKLTKRAGKKAQSDYWPKDAASFSSRLKAIEPSLLEVGISVKRTRTKDKRQLILKRLDR